MRLNWGTSMAIVYTLFATMMILFAIRTSHLKNDLVTENYYNEAVKFQDRINENANGANASTKLNISYSEQSHSITLNVSGEMKALSGKLFFYKPDKASDDFELNFHTGENGMQVIPLSKIAHGYWRVTANYNVDDKNCLEQQRIFVQ